MPTAQEAFIDAIPETGEILYKDLRLKLIGADRQDAVSQFHTFRRKGLFTVRFENDEENGTVKMYISRNPAPVAPTATTPAPSTPAQPASPAQPSTTGQ